MDTENVLEIWKEKGSEGLTSLKMDKLKDELRVRNLRVSGNKSDLVQRLDEHFQQLDQKRKNPDSDESYDNDNEADTEPKKQKTTNSNEKQGTNYVLNVKLARHNCTR